MTSLYSSRISGWEDLSDHCSIDTFSRKKNRYHNLHHSHTHSQIISLPNSPTSTMMMFDELMDFDALFKEFSTVAEDILPLVTESVNLNRKHSSLLNDDYDPPPAAAAAAAEPAAEPSSKRLRRSSSRRIECKARGLSKNHNSSNAYLEIKADATHGLLLSCSHPECADSDRRFRYCQGKKFEVCDVNECMAVSTTKCLTVATLLYFTLLYFSLWYTSCKAKLPEATWTRTNPIFQAADKRSRWGVQLLHSSHYYRCTKLSTLQRAAANNNEQRPNSSYQVQGTRNVQQPHFGQCVFGNCCRCTSWFASKLLTSRMCRFRSKVSVLSR